MKYLIAVEVVHEPHGVVETVPFFSDSEERANGLYDMLLTLQNHAPTIHRYTASGDLTLRRVFKPTRINF